MGGGSHGERVQRSRIQPTSYMWAERSLPYNARLSGIALHAATSGLHRVRIFNSFLILWQRRVERVAEAGPLKTTTRAVVRACVVA